MGRTGFCLCNIQHLRDARDCLGLSRQPESRAKLKLGCRVYIFASRLADSVPFPDDSLVVVRSTLCDGQEYGRVVHLCGATQCSLFIRTPLLTRAPVIFPILLSRTDHDDDDKHRYETERTPSGDGVRFIRIYSFSNYRQRLLSSKHWPRYVLLPPVQPPAQLTCVNIHTGHSLRQISKGIPREASQGEHGSGNPGREQRKGRPLEDGSRVLECALNAVPGYFARGM